MNNENYNEFEQIARFILDSSKKALCTRACVFHDKQRNKKLKQEAGFAYTIIDEDEKGVSFYDEETKSTIKITHAEFSLNFRRKK